jgi:hypothetical protein
MKWLVTILLIAGFGIYAGWWNASQVEKAGTEVVKTGTQVAGAVGDALSKNATPTPKSHK